MHEPAAPSPPCTVTRDVGLCAGCRHARTLVNRRGSRFWLCSRSRTDARFPRYPPLPVVRCAGYEPGEPRTGSAEPEEENDP